VTMRAMYLDVIDPVRIFFCFIMSIELLSVQGYSAIQQTEIPQTPQMRNQTPNEASLQERNPRYQLGAGDVLDISFTFSPEFNQTVAVQPDGFITLRDVGDLHVQGDTVPQLTEALKGAYGRILRQPVITVVLKDFEKPHFVVGGQVGHPGKYDLRGDVTVTEALGIAGGLNDRAKQSQILLFRRVSQEWVEVKNIDVKKVYAGNLQEDIHLRPGDMLLVPQNRFSKVKPFIPTSSVGAYFNPGSPY
jgi:polysaccharide biosynthesis/export protein